MERGETCPKLALHHLMDVRKKRTCARALEPDMVIAVSDVQGVETVLSGHGVSDRRNTGYLSDVR